MEFGQCPFHTTSVDQWPLMFVELGGAWWNSELKTWWDSVRLSGTWWDLVELGGAQHSVGLGGAQWDLVGLSRTQ